jgi:hypothetical protein
MLDYLRRLKYSLGGDLAPPAVAVCIVSRYLDKPKKIHCDMVRKIMWYLRGSLQIFKICCLLWIVFTLTDDE